MNNILTDFMEQDQSSYEYRVWQDNGGHHQAYLDQKCNRKKDCSNKAEYTILYSSQTYSEECACETHAEDCRKYPGQYKIVPYISEILKPFV